MADELSIVYNIGQIFGGWIAGWISDILGKRTPSVFLFLVVAIVPTFLLRVESSSGLYVGILWFASLLFFFPFRGASERKKTQTLNKLIHFKAAHRGFLLEDPRILFRVRYRQI